MVVDILARIARETVFKMAADLEAAAPRILEGLVFIAVAYLLIRGILAVVGTALGRYFGEERALIAQLGVTVVGVFLWFGAGLAFLKIVGLGEIAASLGTAVGFVALGVSYALSEMIEDTVAGVYLLRDPDFQVGDLVEVDGEEGTVSAIELRKSRFTLEGGDTRVLANRDVEGEWTKRAG